MSPSPISLSLPLTPVPSTPIVNDAFLNYIRQGLVQYKRGDTQSITSQGVRFVERTVESKSGDPGVDQVETADV